MISKETKEYYEFTILFFFLLHIIVTPTLRILHKLEHMLDLNL